MTRLFLLLAHAILWWPPFSARCEHACVIADFEDTGTWRARPIAGVPPKGWFSGNLYLASSNREQKNGNWVGELKFLFDGAPPFRLGLERAKMSRISGFIHSISFEVNSKGADCSLAFELEDSSKAKFQTTPVALPPSGWQTCSVAVNANTVTNFDSIQFPAFIRRIILSKASRGEGSIFLDDIRINGRISSANLLAVSPVYEGMAHAPGKPVALHYNIRNAGEAELSGEAQLKVEDIRGGEPREFRQALNVPGKGQTALIFQVGEYPVGSYSGKLTLVTQEARTEYLDFFAVFVPNGKRINRSPMWFGVQDKTTWQGPAENALHQEWLKMLGIDLVRVGISGDKLEPEKGDTTCAPLTTMLEDLRKADIDAFILYTDAAPGWTQSKPAWKAPPDDYAAFEEHAQHVGAYLASRPNVKYLEFWNEPDLEFLKGDLNDYLKMLTAFQKGFRQTAPRIPIISGGVTVIHPAEKKGFSEGMMKRPDLFDIAGFHNHGSVSDYAQRNLLVEQWLKEVGTERPIANTEAGYRSRYDAPGALTQASILVQKIAYAKSRKSSEFYAWFTVQDVWDMDFVLDDSTGLVTSDNRPKPSFLAFNELIRRLSNTVPIGEVELHPDLSAFGFRKSESGELVYVCWPKSGKSAVRLWVKAGGDYIQSDIFGTEQPVASSGAAAMISVSRLPLYLRSARPDDTLQPASPAESFFDLPDAVTSTSGTTKIPLKVRNLWNGDLTVDVEVRSAEGSRLAHALEKLPPKGSADLVLGAGPSVPSRFQSEVLNVQISLAGAVQKEIAVPVTVRYPYPVTGETEAREIIELSKPTDVKELFSDPFRPPWRGPDDLSLRARLRHDRSSLFLEFDVIDSVHVPANGPEKLWNDDSIQVGILPESGGITELALGDTKDGPVVWCCASPVAEKKGLWKTPLQIERQGKRTSYRAEVPLAALGLTYRGKATPFRIALVLNNNDGQGRVRIMQWGGGIAERKDPDQFNYAILE